MNKDMEKIKILYDKIGNIEMKVVETEKKIDTLLVKDKPDEFVTFESEKKTIKGSTRLDLNTPQFIFRNPRRDTSLVKNISIVGDDTFLKKTILHVYLEGLCVYQTKSTGALSHSKSVNLDFPRGIVIDDEKAVKVFVINDTDDVDFSCTVTVGFSEK